MRWKIFIFVAFIWGLANSGGVSADQPATQPTTEPAALKVGDPAPPLMPAKWVKGEPVDRFEKGKVYVVEFWATWCGPCKTTIPHITQLAATFKDVTFIGQDIAERDHAAVEAFVRQMGDKMNYRVCLDDVATARMGYAWMSNGKHGIPTAFVIDNNTMIAWIGYPMDLDPVLKQMQAGTFDPQKTVAAQEVKDNPMGLVESVMEKTGDPDKVLAKIAELTANDPDAGPKLAIVKYEMLVLKKDRPGANAVAKQMIAEANDEPNVLDVIALWMVSPDLPLDAPEFAFAEQAALRANAITKGNDALSLDTLAQVYAAQGHFGKAVATETLALAKSTNAQLTEQYVKSLEGYKTRAAKK